MGASNTTKINITENNTLKVVQPTYLQKIHFGLWPNDEPKSHINTKRLCQVHILKKI
jgi:hypothetical protein